MHREWLYTLDEHGQTPLARAAGSSHMALTEVLLKRCAEDQSASTEGSSTLHKASYLGLHEAVQALLEDGGDANALDKYNETPLHKAARQAHEDCVRLLLKYGADANATDEFGLTPLHWVAMNGHVGIAELLLSQGADPRLCDEYLDDLSPLLLAQIMSYEHLVTVFEMWRPT